YPVHDVTNRFLEIVAWHLTVGLVYSRACGRTEDRLRPRASQYSHDLALRDRFGSALHRTLQKPQYSPPAVVALAPALHPHPFDRAGTPRVQSGALSPPRTLNHRNEYLPDLLQCAPSVREPHVSQAMCPLAIRR